MGPKERRSSTLSAIEEAAVVALRVQARLPLDDVFAALKDVIPHLTRSSLHRCLQRHGISRLPKADREKPEQFKAYEIGYFHLDIAELRTDGGKAYLFVAVDQASKLVCPDLPEGDEACRSGLPQGAADGRALQDPHCADRQRRSIRPA